MAESVAPPSMDSENQDPLVKPGSPKKTSRPRTAKPSPSKSSTLGLDRNSPVPAKDKSLKTQPPKTQPERQTELTDENVDSSSAEVADSDAQAPAQRITSVMVSSGNTNQIVNEIAKELSIRKLGLAKIKIARSARQFVPKGLEVRLSERLIQDLASKTYFEPAAIDGALSGESRASIVQQASKKNQVEGLIVFEIGLEEILGTLFTQNGWPIKKFEFRYLIGEMEKNNAVSILSERIIEGIVQAIPYRGFVTSIGKESATVNLGSQHQIKEGDILELFDFRRPNMNSTRRMMGNVVVLKVNGPTESVVGPIGDRAFPAEPYAKVSFRVSNIMATEATDPSVVSGRWWMGIGGQIQSFGAEAAAPKYESKLFKVNGTPFASLAAGNSIWSFQGAFGSASSTSETLNFFDFMGLYSIYQLGGAQSAWSLSAGGRALLINVVSLPEKISALSTTTVFSPVVEARYQYVPKGRVRVGFSTELFWPVYSTGAELGALIFAFGAGAGVQLQFALASQLGIEVSGKLRYLRRPIEGQSAVQERQSVLSSGLVFSF